MRFTTPCFVRVECPEKRKELIEWLKSVGHYTRPELIDDGDTFVSVGEGKKGGTPITLFSSQFLPKKHINCDTNIDLFKALAAMNDENDYMQWFYVDDNFQLCRYFDRNHDASFRDGMRVLVRKDIRKATAEEIIEYFKTKTQ